MNENTVLRPRADLGFEQVDSDLLILDKRNEQIHQLNQTAGNIWTLLSEGITPDEIASRLSKEFDISFDRARSDVTSALGEFETLGLVEQQSP